MELSWAMAYVTSASSEVLKMPYSAALVSVVGRLPSVITEQGGCLTSSTGSIARDVLLVAIDVLIPRVNMQDMLAYGVNFLDFGDWLGTNTDHE